MNFKVKKAAVLGSGVMGSGIACHLANVGIDVLMLDIQPKEKTIKNRNIIADDALNESAKSKLDTFLTKWLTNYINENLNDLIKLTKHILN